MEQNQISLSVKLLYTAFMCVLIPVYWHFYGPTNFLYFCDVALILTFIGIWRENPFLISMCAVGVLLPQALWIADFIGTGVGFPITGMTAYMFNTKSSLFLRSLSLFHGWLPVFLVYLVWKLGYDRRGFLAWTSLAVILLLFCFFVMPPPNPDPGMTPVNINYVWGMSDNEPQHWLSASTWLAALVLGMPLFIFMPTHFVLQKIAPQAD